MVNILTITGVENGRLVWYRGKSEMLRNMRGKDDVPMGD